MNGSVRKHLIPIVETETTMGNVFETEADGKGKIIIGQQIYIKKIIKRNHFFYIYFCS